MNVTVKDSVNNRTLLALDKMQKLASRWLTTNEQMLIDRCNMQSSKNTDASILYMLYTDYGFTAEQLLEFYNNHKERYAHLDAYAFSIADIEEVTKLKNIGVDLTALYEGE